MSSLPYADLIQAQHDFFQAGKSRSLAARREALALLQKQVTRLEPQVQEALHADLRKHPQEAYMTEIGAFYSELAYLRKRLRRWMQPRPVASPLFLLPGSSTIYPEPVGMVLIITPWNYPFLLSLKAAAGALAAGNTVILKPSEISAHTAKVLEELVNTVFPEGQFRVLTGEGQQVIPNLLLNYHFDHVHFTGSTTIGSKIMEMAARHLSPVTLELGGKSPAIIGPDAPLPVTAKRLVWGKFLNCGQTCVAPDYLLVHQSILPAFLDAMKRAMVDGFGADPQQSASYPRIINRKRFEVLASYLQQGTVVMGGQQDANDLYIAPTLLTDVSLEAPVMREEIFGPILPILTYNEPAEALAIIQHNPYPLALYVFSHQRSLQRYFLEQVRFSGGAINETVIHLGNHALPFGGVGYSGHGQYSGEHSFNTFSHFKSVVKKATWFEPSFRHPPYTTSKFGWIRRFLG